MMRLLPRLIFIRAYTLYHDYDKKQRFIFTLLNIVCTYPNISFLDYYYIVKSLLKIHRLKINKRVFYIAILFYESRHTLTTLKKQREFFEYVYNDGPILCRDAFDWNDSVSR